MNPPSRHGSVPSQRGVALVLTLTILVLATMLVLAVFLRMSSERVDSSAGIRQSEARQMAAGVVDLVKSTITQAASGYESGPDGSFTTKRTAWASQPGLIRTWGEDGSAYKTYRLYSSGQIVNTGTINLAAEQTEIDDWKSGSTSYNALWCDLNAPADSGTNAGTLSYPIVTPPKDTRSGSVATDINNGVPTDDPATAAQEGVQGFAITSAPGFASGTSPGLANNPAPMPVKWLYVLQDGTFVTPTGSGTVAAVAGASQTNPIVGRVAYWTDDETCKVNINTASEGIYWDKPYGMSREESGTTGALGYSLSVPVQNEFQRLPGHPAFTSLSAVYGAWLPRPDIGFSNTGPNGAAAYTGGTFSGNILPYFNLSPRIGDGGTQGGTRSVTAPAAGDQITLDAARLYASSDEPLYSPATSPRSLNNSSLTPDRVKQTAFFVTANSKAPETTLLEQPRISLWPIQQSLGARNAQDKLLAFASTIPVNGSPYYFQRVSEWESDDSPGSSQSSTLDISHSRNASLLRYLLNTCKQTLPGFGGKFSDKYTGGTLPQILVQMFDTVRSLVNTTSRSLTPTYSFAPYGLAGNYESAVGLASVVPSRASLDGKEVKGFGRFPTITEVVIVFMATSWKDETTLGAAAPFTPTPGPDNLPDDVPDHAGAFNGVGDPQTTSIRAVIYLIPLNPAPGQPDMAPAVRYQVEGLENLTIDGINLGFPSAGNAVLITRSNLRRTIQPETGIESQLMWGSGTDGSYARSAGPSTGVTTSTGSSDPQIKLYPLIGADVALPIAAEASRWGLGVSGDYTDLRPAIAPTTMAFNGGRLTIRIFPGSGNTFSGNDLIQEIEVNFPASRLPVPQVVRARVFAGPDSNGVRDFNSTAVGMTTDPKSVSFYSGIGAVSNADGRDFPQRLHCTISGGAGARNMPSLIRRGDVMRSVYLDPAGPSGGDLRVVAALRYVPGAFLTAFPGYTDTNILQACAGGVRGTTGGLARRSSVAYGTARLDKNPDSFKNQPNRPDADYQGTPLSLSYYNRARPNVPFGLSEARMGTLLGDLNTGVGGILDGPYIGLADQGFVSEQSKQYNNIYYPSNAGDSTSAQAITTFSPNRQVSSPVIFGSLPSGITPLANLSDSGTQTPWRTLLFCPNPAAKSSHPGFSNPPDHLFLDNFWMPTVEPYAISEPLATAGKINLNYQIAPFGYIERSTGLYAALKALKMPAIPDALSASYRTDESALPGSSSNPTWRYNIDVPAVVAGMKSSRFSLNDAYRSASEVCSIFLVPGKQPGATAATPNGPSGSTPLQRYNNTANWWDDKRLTGDNLRETPYDQIYSRITTKSNTYTVHMRVQALKQTGAGGWDKWDEVRDQVMSEYRGSATIKRYIDPSDPDVPDFALPANYSKNLAPYYRWRTVAETQFIP